MSITRAHVVGWTRRILPYALAAGAILYIGVYIFVALSRMRYPYELEWMEGAAVDHVKRIVSGQGLYVSPSLEFISWIYTPLYFYISAAVSSVIGIGFFPLRLVSFISSLACFLLIFLIVKQETRSNFAGLISAGLFAATFRQSGAWFDLARVDSTYLCFLLAAIYFLRFETSAVSYGLAGVFISLSFLTKQTALVVFSAMILYVVALNWRRSVFFLVPAIAIIGITTFILNSTTGGWYNYYVFGLAFGWYNGSSLDMGTTTSHPVQWRALVSFWTNSLIGPFVIASAFSVYYLLAEWLKSAKKFWFYFLLSLSMIGVSWAGALNWGGYNNVLFPAYAIVSILFGMAVHEAIGLFSGYPETQRSVAASLVLLLCVGQFVSLLYNPFPQVPSQKDRQAGQALVDRIRQTSGPVLVLSHGYLAELAGKSSYSHSISISDIFRPAGASQTEIGAKIMAEARQALSGKKFSMIILDSYADFLDAPWLLEEIRRYYTEQGKVFDDPTIFWTRTGLITRPEYVYVPK